MEVAQVPAKLDIVLYAGDDFALTINVVTVDPVTNVETPVNFTGCTALMQIKSRPAETAALLQLTSSPAAGLSFPAPATDGNIKIELTKVQTGTTLPKASLYYDLQITDSLTKVRTYFTGMISIKNDTTR